MSTQVSSERVIEKPARRSGSVVVGLGVILLVGAVVRVLGLSWGLPFELHPDEWVIVDGALDMAARNSFEPSLYLRPDHVEIKLSFLAYTAFSYVAFQAPVEIGYSQDPGAFLIISRLITVGFGLIMILLAFLIGRRLTVSIGLIAAGLFAVFPAFVEHSHFATPDIPLTAVVMALALAGIHYIERPGLVPLLFASASAAIAIAIKYPGAISTTMIAVVIIVAALRDKAPIRILTHGAIAIGSVVAFLFIIAPNLFTNFSAVTAALKQESRSTHLGADGLSFFGNLKYYGDVFIMNGGYLIVVFMVIGLIFMAMRRELRSIPIAIGFVFWIVLSALPLHWERWGVPMYASGVMFAAIGLHGTFELLRAQVRNRTIHSAIIAVVSIVIAANLVAGTSSTVARLMSTDTRLAAAPAVAAAGATTQNTAFEGYSPLRPDASDNIFDEVNLTGEELRYDNEDVEFVLLSSCMYDRYASEAKYADEQAVYAAIRSNLELEYTLKPFVPPAAVGLEIPNIIGQFSTTASYVTGSLSGCEIQLFSR